MEGAPSGGGLRVLAKERPLISVRVRCTSGGGGMQLDMGV